MHYPDVMVDIETTGIQPENTSIIQLAAYRFNLKEATIDPKPFDRCLMPMRSRYWDESTRDFWTGKNADVLDQIWKRLEAPYLVMSSFIDWVVKDNQCPGYTLWAKPTHFEWPFLESYFRELSLTGPFHYRSANDLNSFIRGRYWPETPPDFERDLEFVGDLHHARWDTLHQIRVLFAAVGHDG